MRVILLKRARGIGDIGNIKEVADGYALNFLIPQRIAELATSANIEKFKAYETKELKQSDQDLISTQKKAQQLAGLIIEIKGTCNRDGKLYSAIGTAVVVEKLKEKGINVDSRQVNLIKPIKELGEHTVFIILNHGLESEITVIVTE